MSKKLNLVVFLIPPEKIINGGILSIFSICEVSREFSDIHKSDVYIATYPGTKSYRKNDLFENDEIIYSFDEIMRLGTPESLLLHVPEYASWNMSHILQGEYHDYIADIKHLHVNILNQNILLMQAPVEVAQWFALTSNVTQTTAHTKYTNQALADTYFMPAHYLSVFIDHRQYDWTPLDKKEDIIALSPDLSPLREKIVKKVQQAFPAYKLITIQNMTYKDYKNLMSRAKFTLGFGEGFDGYYTESFFSGGITFSVYNEDFFPDKTFGTYENTYQSYDDMLKYVAKNMQALVADTKSYKELNSKNLGLINGLYGFERYKANIKHFYQGKYTYVPQPGSGERLMGEVITEYERLINVKFKELKERDKAISGQSAMIRERDDIIATKDQKIEYMLNSRSWKVTKPFRAAARIAKRKH
jgi:hypothetical protein